MRIDRSFRSLVATQFLGAFNDNAFKQLVLLIAVAETRRQGGPSYQALATALFALPFVLFSGIAGSVADRFGKTHVIRASKVAEIWVMVLGGFALASEGMAFLLSVVFLMGAQSAFFGPAKYGILPEMLPRKELAPANGIMLMTTFLAIILGMASAGVLRDFFKEHFHGDVFWCAGILIAIAVIGTATSWRIRLLRPAQPDLPILTRPLGDLIPTIRSITRDRFFLSVILASCYFWFLGGVFQQTVNSIGREIMELDNRNTSLLLATLSVGIAAGSLLCGMLSGRGDPFRWSRIGIAGLIAGLTTLTFVTSSLVWTHVILFLLGVSGGLFAVPLQAFIQARAEADRRGRVVAAANFSNWIFILLSAGYFGLAHVVLPASLIPLSLAVCTLLAGPYLLRRPRSPRLP